jgi:hypothetical protein
MASGDYEMLFLDNLWPLFVFFIGVGILLDTVRAWLL